MKTSLNGFTFGQVNSRADYEGLRDLWCRTFDDEPDLVDSVYRIFVLDPDTAFAAEAIGEPIANSGAADTIGEPIVSFPL